MSYQKQNFANGEVLTAPQLNHIEDGIVDVESAANTTKTVVDNIIDPTLSLSGKAADAKATGDALKNMNIRPATSTILGGIKVGSGLSVTDDGTLSSDAQGYTLPAATATTLGGVKVGSGLKVYSDGTIDVTSVNDFTIRAQTTDPGAGSYLTTGTVLLVYA